jgi:hypothetical protein
MLIVESGTGRKDVLQPHEIEKLYEQDRDTIEFALTAFGTKYSKQWNSIVRAAFAYCAAFAPTETAQLATMLREKHGYKKGSAAHAFVIALSDNKLPAGGNSDRIDTMAKVLWLIRAHIEGRQVVHVKATASVFNWAARQRQEKNKLMMPLLGK